MILYIIFEVVFLLSDEQKLFHADIVEDNDGIVPVIKTNQKISQI